MKIAIVTLVLNQSEITNKCIASWVQTKGDDTPIFVVDNGSTIPYANEDVADVIRFEENKGVLPAMQEAYYQFDHYDYILFLHNDVEIYEKNWMRKVKRILEAHPEIGVAGFYGAKYIGASNIYQVPYELHQLARGNNVSGCYRMDKAHGYRLMEEEMEYVAVLDGFSLCINVEMLKKNNGFDMSTGYHHMYDNMICLDSLNLGYKNAVIAMDAFHYGGQTDVKEEWNAKFNLTKSEIHSNAHVPFYEKWKPRNMSLKGHSIALPVIVQ